VPSADSSATYRRSLDWIAIAAGILAILVAGYLTIVHYQDGLLVCSVVEGCETVQQSEYAEIGPFPVALLGLLASVAMLALAVLRMKVPGYRFAAGAALFGMLLASVLYLGYLTYLELVVIDAICQWCVTYFGIVLIWAILEGWRMWRNLFADGGEFEED